MSGCRFYEFEVRLHGAGHDVWRRFYISTAATFEDLHHAIVNAGPWGGSRPYQFYTPEARPRRLYTVITPSFTPPPAAPVRTQSLPGVVAQLQSHDAEVSSPEIPRPTRTQSLPGGSSPGVSSPGGSPPAVPPNRALRLADYFPDGPGKPGNYKCLYVYDERQPWVHEVSLMRCLDYPERFLRKLSGGNGAFPPEEVGGPKGYARLMALARRTDPTQLNDHERNWYNWLTHWNPAAFDFERTKIGFDL